MPIPLAVPLVISGLASLFGAKKAADAAGKASSQQVAAGDRALAFEKEKYEQGRRDLAPWQTAGQGAMVRLNERLGLPAMQLPNDMVNRPPAPRAMVRAQVPAKRGAGGDEMVDLRSVGAGRTPGAAANRLHGYGGGDESAGMPRGGMVTIESPDGQRGSFPAHIAEQFIRLGARRVGGM